MIKNKHILLKHLLPKHVKRPGGSQGGASAGPPTSTCRTLSAAGLQQLSKGAAGIAELARRTEGARPTHREIVATEKHKYREHRRDCERTCIHELSLKILVTRSCVYITATSLQRNTHG